MIGYLRPAMHELRGRRGKQLTMRCEPLSLLTRTYLFQYNFFACIEVREKISRTKWENSSKTEILPHPVAVRLFLRPLRQNTKILKSVVRGLYR
jgi:hypothetical protein